MNRFVRPLYLGGIAGLLTALGYVGLLLINVFQIEVGYFIYLGGHSTINLGHPTMIINGVPRVTLSSLDYITIFMLSFWGLGLAKVIDAAHRPRWWQVAPLMWISWMITTLLAIVLIYIDLWEVINTTMDDYVNGLSNWTASLICDAVFGALFGLTMRSGNAILILSLASPVTFILANFMVLIFPENLLLATIGVGNENPNDSFMHLQTAAALHQILVLVFHGSIMGIVICEIDRKQHRGPTLVLG
jgi:hypothetical protein